MRPAQAVAAVNNSTTNNIWSTRTIRQWVDIVLNGQVLTMIVIKKQEGTYDPKEPSLHVERWYHVSGILYDVGNKECSESECSIKIRTEQAKSPEETLHSEIGNVVEQMKCPETSSRPRTDIMMNIRSCVK